MKKITAPLTHGIIAGLRCGQDITLDGVIYTARDQAHNRLVELFATRRKVPLSLRNQVIYYCGPTKAPRGKPIGSAGPTTSSRMDSFTPAPLRHGLRVMIGKGSRSRAVRDAIKKYQAVYCVTYAGCGALLARHIVKARPVAFKQLGPEAIYELHVKDLPLIVAIDSRGRSIYAAK